MHAATGVGAFLILDDFCDLIVFYFSIRQDDSNNMGKAKFYLIKL